jgi:hypothetical protein
MAAASSRRLFNRIFTLMIPYISQHCFLSMSGPRHKNTGYGSLCKTDDMGEQACFFRPKKPKPEEKFLFPGETGQNGPGCSPQLVLFRR